MDAPLFLVGFMLFFDHVAFQTPFWIAFGRVLGSILEGFGVDFGGFPNRFDNEISYGFRAATEATRNDTKPQEA